MDIHKENEITFCTFYLSNRLFGIDILNVKEVNKLKEMTAIQHAPEEIRGYVNIRGNLYLIADMKKVMGFPESTGRTSGKLIIFKPKIMEFTGIYVDDIGDTVTVRASDIFNRRQTATKQNESFQEKRKDDCDISEGVIQLEKELLISLSAPKIIQKLKQA